MRDNICNTLNLDAERIHKKLGNKISRLTKFTDGKFKFYPRVVNQTDILFAGEEQTLLNKDLKYNLNHKNKYWIRKLALEAENVSTLLPLEEQDYMRHQVAKQIRKITSPTNCK